MNMRFKIINIFVQVMTSWSATVSLPHWKK